jgi:hypothetical protein
VLFPPSGDGKKLDAARRGLSQLGYTDDVIEEQFGDATKASADAPRVTSKSSKPRTARKLSATKESIPISRSVRDSG